MSLSSKNSVILVASYVFLILSVSFPSFSQVDSMKIVTARGRAKTNEIDAFFN